MLESCLLHRFWRNSEACPRCALRRAVLATRTHWQAAAGPPLQAAQAQAMIRRALAVHSEPVPGLSLQLLSLGRLVTPFAALIILVGAVWLWRQSVPDYTQLARVEPATSFWSLP